MSFISKFTNVFRESDDDEFDDYDDYEDDFNDSDEGASKRRFFAAKSEDTEADERPQFRKKNVVSYRGKAKGEVVVIRPNSMEDANQITDTLQEGKAVVLNLEGIHVELAQRIIDYSAGSCYAISGSLQKITSYIFLITPPGVDISGDIQELAAGASNGIDLGAYKSDVRF